MFKSLNFFRGLISVFASVFHLCWTFQARLGCGGRILTIRYGSGEPTALIGVDSLETANDLVLATNGCYWEEDSGKLFWDLTFFQNSKLHSKKIRWLKIKVKMVQIRVVVLIFFPSIVDLQKVIV